MAKKVDHCLMAVTMEYHGTDAGEIGEVRAEVDEGGRSDVKHLREATDVFVRQAFRRILELQFHPERVVFPAKVRLLSGLHDATKHAERPWSRGEVAEEGGRLDGRTKALGDEDVAIVGVTSEVGVHVGPDECGVGETEAEVPRRTPRGPFWYYRSPAAQRRGESDVA